MVSSDVAVSVLIDAGQVVAAAKDVSEQLRAENAELRKRCEEQENRIAVARDALEEIHTGPADLTKYFFGIRCGVEDNELQNLPYEAAEYAYGEGLRYCSYIANRGLAALKGAKP